MKNSERELTIEEARRLPKIVLHEHYDCSIRPEHILDVSTKRNLKIPAQFSTAWRKAGDDANQRSLVASQYQLWLKNHARQSLTNYLSILWSQVLPTLQTSDDLYKTAKERIDDAVADGIVFLKLRFAPQLHLREGLKLQQVVDSIQQAASEAPFSVRLVICALRHENREMAEKLADLVIQNPLVTTFDLAGDESKFPGVLDWWAKEAKRVVKAGKQVSCHIGETNEITTQDHLALDEIGCSELGHGIKGDPHNKLCTICVTSNLVTHVVEDVASHPINEMYDKGRNISIDLDGTLLTGVTLSEEYCLLNRVFGWNLDEFLRCNLDGLEHVPLDATSKAKLSDLLYTGYRSVRV